MQSPEHLDELESENERDDDSEADDEADREAREVEEFGSFFGIHIAAERL